MAPHFLKKLTAILLVLSSLIDPAWARPLQGSSSHCDFDFESQALTPAGEIPYLQTYTPGLRAELITKSGAAQPAKPPAARVAEAQKLVTKHLYPEARVILEDLLNAEVPSGFFHPILESLQTVLEEQKTGDEERLALFQKAREAVSHRLEIEPVDARIAMSDVDYYIAGIFRNSSRWKEAIETCEAGLKLLQDPVFDDYKEKLDKAAARERFKDGAAKRQEIYSRRTQAVSTLRRRHATLTYQQWSDSREKNDLQKSIDALELALSATLEAQNEPQILGLIYCLFAEALYEMSRHESGPVAAGHRGRARALALQAVQLERETRVPIPTASLIWGKISLAQNRWVMARDSFLEVIRMKTDLVLDDHPIAYEGLAHAYLQLGELEEASALFSEMSADDPETLLVRARIQAARGEFEKAIEIYVGLWKEPGQSGLEKRHLTDVYFRQAVRALLHVQNLAPGAPDAGLQRKIAQDLREQGPSDIQTQLRQAVDQHFPDAEAKVFEAVLETAIRAPEFEQTDLPKDLDGLVLRGRQLVEQQAAEDKKEGVALFQGLLDQNLPEDSITLMDVIPDFTSALEDLKEPTERRLAVAQKLWKLSRERLKDEGDIAYLPMSQATLDLALTHQAVQDGQTALTLCERGIEELNKSLATVKTLKHTQDSWVNAAIGLHRLRADLLTHRWALTGIETDMREIVKERREALKALNEWQEANPEMRLLLEINLAFDIGMLCIHSPADVSSLLREAEKLTGQVLKADPKSQEGLFTKAHLANHHKQWDEAIAILEHLWSESDQELAGAAAQMLLQAWTGKNAAQEAEAYIESALVKPEGSSLYYAGLVYFLQAHYDKARDYWEKALEHPRQGYLRASGEIFELQRGLAILDARSGQVAKAMANLAPVVEAGRGNRLLTEAILEGFPDAQSYLVLATRMAEQPSDTVTTFMREVREALLAFGLRAEAEVLSTYFVLAALRIQQEWTSAKRWEAVVDAPQVQQDALQAFFRRNHWPTLLVDAKAFLLAGWAADILVKPCFQNRPANASRFLDEVETVLRPSANQDPLSDKALEKLHEAFGLWPPYPFPKSDTITGKIKNIRTFLENEKNRRRIAELYKGLEKEIDEFAKRPLEERMGITEQGVQSTLVARIAAVREECPSPLRASFVETHARLEERLASLKSEVDEEFTRRDTEAREAASQLAEVYQTLASSLAGLGDKTPLTDILGMEHRLATMEATFSRARASFGSLLTKTRDTLSAAKVVAEGRELRETAVKVQDLRKRWDDLLGKLRALPKEAKTTDLKPLEDECLALSTESQGLDHTDITERSEAAFAELSIIENRILVRGQSAAELMQFLRNEFGFPSLFFYPALLTALQGGMPLRRLHQLVNEAKEISSYADLKMMAQAESIRDYLREHAPREMGISA